MAVPAFVTVLVAVVAAALGVVAGLAVGRSRSRARRAARRQEGPTVAELLARLVRRSRSGLVVINRFGDVVLSNERAEELGAVVGARPAGPIATAAYRVASGGEASEIDLSPAPSTGGAPRSVIADIRPLGDGFVVVDASDTSDAVRLEAVRRDFVANVGHELKTPVGAMGVLAEAVLDADDPDEVTHFATKILHESRRLGALVVELIALSRLQGADRLPELARVDVDAVLGDALARVRGTSSSGAVGQGSASGELPDRDRFHVDDPSGLAVAGDRTLLVTALTNLLENALAYSTDGSPVSIRRRSVGGHVEISVIDRGIGIAPEHQERVFERFFRVDPARSRATGGTGLGLAIVKHVAANHGGEVRLWSEPGVGSTFSLCIPASPEGSRPTVHAATPAAAPAATPMAPVPVPAAGRRSTPPSPSPSPSPRPARPRPAVPSAPAPSAATTERDRAAALPGPPGGSS